MAVTVQTTFGDRGVIKVVATFTADGDATFTLPRCTIASFEAVSSNFAGGTIELQAAPDAVNYAALPTAKTLAATGIKSVAPADLSFYNYRFDLSGSVTPATITVTLIVYQMT